MDAPGKRPPRCAGSDVLGLSDRFSDDRREGRVIGTCPAGGAVRRGRDVEQRIAIDHGALRMQPLLTPGWGRQGVVYGPYRRAAGLTLAVSIINGHNTSQGGPIEEGFRGRFWRWSVGSQTEPRAKRLLDWLGSRQKKGTLRRFRWWRRNMSVDQPPPACDENLAVGWFPSEAPEDPLAGGNAFVVHAAEGDNGELWAAVAGRPLEAFRQLQNLHLYYLVVLRAKGAAYYASSVPDAFGVAPFPMMRPIAIDPFDDAPTLYAGIYQAVLGQVGFRVDTRVPGVDVVRATEMSAWYGSAHAADGLVGKGDLQGAVAEVGGTWRVSGGRYVLTDQGPWPDQAGACAVLDPGAPSGLVHALVETTGGAGGIGIVWRHRDEHNHWLVQLSRDGCRLILVEAGRQVIVARDGERHLKPHGTSSVQILDGHGQFGLHLDGARLFDAWFADDRLQDASGVGLRALQAGGPLVRALEAHPTSVPMPAAVRLDPPWVRSGGNPVVADRFSGDARDLNGRPAEMGDVIWTRTLGEGVIELTGAGQAKVRASVESPNPGRTAYTVPWKDAGFADVETTIVPPGSGKGQGEKGRAGLIFWQDARNYLTFTSWLDDGYDGSSIALFSHLNGFEELYDAIWTMLSNKIDWGRPFRLRIVFDGVRFTVLLDREPVLHRALTDLYPEQPPLRITRVGLVVNWEWGDDTGSVFEDFVARARAQ